MLVVFVCDAVANNYWDDPANVEAYAAIAAGNDGAALAARLAEWVSPQASVLELGMGTGADLELLARRFAQVTGSDRARDFCSGIVPVTPTPICCIWMR